MLASSQLSLGGAPVERLDDGAEAVLVDAFPVDRGPANIGVRRQVSGNMPDIGQDPQLRLKSFRRCRAQEVDAVGP
jgi:hypothetical protein